MSVVLITGAAGLVGSEAALFFANKGFDVVGIDNDMRRYFFGDDGSTAWRRVRLEQTVRGYRHVSADIRDESSMNAVFGKYGRDRAALAALGFEVEESHHELEDPNGNAIRARLLRYRRGLEPQGA